VDQRFEDIKKLEGQLKADWSDRDEAIKETRDLRFMENDLDFPAAVEPEVVRAPIGHQIVERMTGTLTADPLTITVPPSSETAKSQEQSSKMEKFALVALDQLEKQADREVSDLFVQSLIADGHGCMRMLYAPQIWRGLPKRRRKQKETDTEYNSRTEEWKRGKPLPISWTWLDPLTVYPMWGGLGLEAILETDARDVITLDERRWNVEKPDLWQLSEQKHGDTGQVTFQQLWTPDSLTYAVEGEIVHQQKHKYGTPPYAYNVGLGAASSDRKYMGYSVLYPIRHLLPYLDRLLCQKGTAIRMWCWPTVIFKAALAAGGDAAEAIRQTAVTPGGTIRLYEDEDITFLTWRGNGPDMDEMIQLVMKMIERAGFGDTMYGQSTGDSGYAINQLIAAARMRYKPIVAHAERSLEQQVMTLFDIAEDMVPGPLHVFNYGKSGGWITIGADDLRGYRQIRVRLNPLMPTDTYARSSQALNEVRGGLRSVSSAMEMIGIEQPDEEARKIRVDRWMNRPEIDTYMTQQAVKRLGLKLAKGDMTMGRLKAEYPQIPEQLQGVLAQQLQQTAPQGRSVAELGMAPPQGMPQQAQGMPQQAIPPEVMQAVAVLAQRYNVPPQQMLQQLMALAQQMGIPLLSLIQMLMQQGNITRQPTVSAPMGGTPGQRFTGAGPQVMASPNVRAAPAPPPHVGPVTRPAGIRQGAAPMTKTPPK